MRQSCQILRQIEALKGTATTAILRQLLPDIDPNTLAATIGNMVRQDRIQKNGKAPKGKGFCYRVNDDWEPGLARKSYKKPSGAGVNKPPTGSEQRQRSPGNMRVIIFREQKVNLLLKLHKNAGAYLSPNERDLLIGLLADLGYTTGRTA